MTPKQARKTAKHRIEIYLATYDTESALNLMRHEVSEYIYWILHLQKGRKWEVIEGGKDEHGSVVVGPCVVRATGDV